MGRSFGLIAVLAACLALQLGTAEAQPVCASKLDYAKWLIGRGPACKLAFSSPSSEPKILNVKSSQPVRKDAPKPNNPERVYLQGRMYAAHTADSEAEISIPEGAFVWIDSRTLDNEGGWLYVMYKSKDAPAEQEYAGGYVPKEFVENIEGRSSGPMPPLPLGLDEYYADADARKAEEAAAAAGDDDGDDHAGHDHAGHDHGDEAAGGEEEDDPYADPDEL